MMNTTSFNFRGRPPLLFGGSTRTRPQFLTNVSTSKTTALRIKHVYTRKQPHVKIYAYSGDLSTYPRYPFVGSKSSKSPWLDEAITEIVRTLDSTPFLQLVRFNDGHKPKFSSVSVPNSVVSTPELWQAVAETVSSVSADVVILAHRISTDTDPDQKLPTANSSNDNTSFNNTNTASTSRSPSVQDAHNKLLAAGLGRSVLSGKVGECCDDTHTHSNTSIKKNAYSGITSLTRDAMTASLPSAVPSRTAVKVTAIPPPGSLISSTQPLSGYWGIVVQSKHHTGEEGCYLLRAVRQVSAPSSSSLASDPVGGCSCTHYSLTKVCKGEQMERQFINSWLV